MLPAQDIITNKNIQTNKQKTIQYKFTKYTLAAAAGAALKAIVVASS